MNPLTPVFISLAAAVLLIALGYWLHGRSAAGIVPAGVRPAWHTREAAVDNLKALRAELEMDGQYGRVEAFLLFDVASYLGFDEAEIQAIVRVGWFEFICNPADLDLEDV